MTAEPKPEPLKSCPFCGGVRPCIQNGSETAFGRMVLVWCPDCFASSREERHESATIAAWNTRTPAPGAEPRQIPPGNIAEVAPHASYCDVALSDAQYEGVDEKGERLWFFDDSKFDASLAGNGYKVVPVGAPDAEAARRVYDKLNALLMAEGSRMKGTPMIPLHESTLREIMDALATAEAARREALVIALVIERAEQACRYALKHQTFEADDAPQYQHGWEVAAEICEHAIKGHVERHIADDIARALSPAQPEEKG